MKEVEFDFLKNEMLLMIINNKFKVFDGNGNFKKVFYQDLLKHFFNSINVVFNKKKDPVAIYKITEAISDLNDCIVHGENTAKDDEQLKEWLKADFESKITVLKHQLAN